MKKELTARLNRRFLRRLLDDGIPASGRALKVGDIGCGPCDTVRMYLDRLGYAPGFRIRATDFNSEYARPRRYRSLMARQSSRTRVSWGRERKILVDYLRNNRTNTSVAAYSMRAKPHAPVSMPLEWDELSADIKSDHYSVANALGRVRALKHDPWNEYWRTGQRIPADTAAALSTLRPRAFLRLRRG